LATGNGSQKACEVYHFLIKKNTGKWGKISKRREEEGGR
jgi:hypothetical protein